MSDELLSQYNGLVTQARHLGLRQARAAVVPRG